MGGSPLITAPDKLPPLLAASVRDDEAAWIGELRRRGLLPFAVTPHFASLAGPERDDPIRRQFFPDPREALPDPFALDDPLGEAHYRAAPRLVHQYRDRALLLAGGSCAGYCRHCFRRVWMAGPQGFAGSTAGSDHELAPELAYLRVHGEIREILVSGGDPLTADDGSLAGLFRQIREARPETALRVCTRLPVTCPQRLGPDTLELFRQYHPLRLAVHINHPRELAPAARASFAACTAAGIPVLVQTVLLRGINDRVETLSTLFRECRSLGLSPYYLFQMDLAPGTAHFRVPLGEGLALYAQLAQSLAKDPGGTLPPYAVDLPGGGGKIRLGPEAVAGERDTPAGRVCLLRGPGGRLWPYPVS
jgi:lysine 2,3-aminomutase